MVTALLNEPTLYFYGKSNSGKTLVLLRLADLYAPHFPCVHFYSPSRAKYYASLISATNVVFHTATTDEMLLRKLEAVDKDCLVLIDDMTILVTGQPAWKALDKSLRALSFKKIILSMDSNPHVLDSNHCLPVLRCDQRNNQVSLLYKSEEMPLDDVITYMNRRLVLDDYCNGM